MKKVKYKPKKGKKREGMKKHWKIVIIIAIILVILVAGFFSLRAYQIKREANVFTNAFQIGYAQAIVQLMNLSLSCEPVPLYAGNSTLEVIAIDCLQFQGQPTQ